MNKIFLVSVLMAAGLFYQSQSVSAHVLIRDETSTVGAVLHITPGDDPEAGMPSTISLSIDNISLESNDSKLLVKSVASGTTDELDYTQHDGSLTAEYIFPSQGTYELMIQAKASNTKQYNFLYTQRVSKGIGVNSGASSHPFARFASISTSIILVITIFVIVKKRKAIAKQSLF